MVENNQFDIIIVGGGIVGLAAAYKINKKYPSKKILVLEKENQVAAHQTGHNSGVIHSGLYYKPGSYKAKNCVDGRRELVAFAKEHKIPHDICGKIVVATDVSELAHMNKVLSNGLANGVEGIEKIDAKRIKEIEPHCVGIEGLWVPCTGIIDYADVSRKYMELIQSAFTGSKVLTGHEVTAFEKHDGYTDVITSKAKFKGNYIITCAGLQSDRIAKKEGAKVNTAIVGFRGDYFELTVTGLEKVRNLIYPVPDPKYPFLGVHFTRMIHGGVECGPNAVFVFKREGYGKTDFSLKDTMEAFAFGGTYQAEIGYELLPAFQGQGIMQEATSKVIAFGLDVIGLKAIEAYTHLENENSSNLLKKFNFKKQENIDNNSNDMFVIFKLSTT